MGAPSESEAREYADGDSRGADPAVLSDGHNKVAPHWAVQEEETPQGRNWLALKRDGAAHEGACRAGKKNRHWKASNHGGGEYPQKEVAEGTPGEISTRPVGRIIRKVRASTSWAKSTERPDAPVGQRETEPEKALLGGISRT